MVPPPPGLALESLLGTWHVVATTLPFWRGRRAPTITYGALPGPGVRWSDSVRYLDRGWGGRWSERSIEGVDTGAPDAPGRFRWRGKGLLGVLSSDWQVVDADPDGAWMVTWFARATFGVTPEGMDVCARSPDPGAAAIDAVLARVRARPELAHLGGWFRPDP